MKNDGLEELFLDSNVIGDIGANAIARLVHPAGATQLRTISVRSNRITDVGAKRILDNVKNNGGILEIDLAHNPISQSILNQLKAKLDTNCCTYLRAMVKNREDSICLKNAATRGCYNTASQLADKIRAYYEPRVECCKRFKMNRCL